jgi:peptidoglycan/LPS O-acetylase OafA/YrhL
MARDNNFDFMRLVGAALVIVGHAFVLTGEAPPGMLGMGLHSLGVKIFFVVSGYLVTESWLRDPSVLRFLLRRSLRIFPALIACVLMTVLLLGPVVTRLPMTDYLVSPVTWDYLSNIALYVRFGLPGVFESNTFPNAVNGSLWTLPVEFVAYSLLPLVLLLMRLRGGAWLAAALALGLVIAEIGLRGFPITEQPVIYATGVISGLQLTTYFVIGSAYRLLRLERFLHVHWAALLLATSMLVPVGGVTLALWQYLAIPYVTLAFAMPRVAHFARVSRYGDFSYGLYLYAFPMQQLAVLLSGNEHTPYANMAFALATAGMLAVFSWHYVERPAQALKPRKRAQPPRAVPAAVAGSVVPFDEQIGGAIASTVPAGEDPGIVNATGQGKVG